MKARTRRLPAAERRAQLIDVARRVFAERGFEAASIEEIAERARVTRPIVYGHFGDKPGLFAVVVDREMQEVLSQVGAALQEGSPRQRLERVVLAFLAYVRERPDGFALLSRETPARAGLEGLSGLLGEIAESVGRTMRPALRAAGYDQAAAPIYAWALIGMTTFAGLWWTQSRRPPPIEEVAAHVAALGWMGLRQLPLRPSLVDAPPRVPGARPGRSPKG